MNTSRICKFQIIVEAVPMVTPIGIIWDKSYDKWIVGIIILCFVIGIQCDRKKGDNVL